MLRYSVWMLLILVSALSAGKCILILTICMSVCLQGKSEWFM